MKINEIERKSLDLLKHSIYLDKYGTYETSSEDYEFIRQELQQHYVSALVVPYLTKINNIPENVLSQWESDYNQQIYQYVNYNNKQKQVIKCLQDNKISFAILKGTSASCYYPIPQLRAMGDIDIMTKREDIDTVCYLLEEIGYKRIQLQNDFGRTIKYIKGNLEIEVHNYFTSLNDPEKAEYLDDIILANIEEGNTRLPDGVNGLVLLEHLGDHLEHGLGLRQIIDWMMYVRSCLSDAEWEDWFSYEAKKTGLDKLAIVVTRMCQLYLGLDDNIKWCNKADIKVCRELMAYIMSSGNFGNKELKNIQRRETIEVLTNNQGLFQKILLLQKYGEQNWISIRKYSFLKPFAWIYQLFHSIKKRIQAKTSIAEMFTAYRESQSRKKLFESLGVKQYAKGLAVRNGEHFEMREKNK